MQASKTLPPNYEPRGTIDLSENRLAAIGLNIVAMLLLLPLGWLTLKILTAVRPEIFDMLDGQWPTILDNLATPIVLIAASFLPIVPHELVHGCFSWFFTHERPKFGIKGLYAYTANPDWYFPRDQFIVVALAPLFLITLIGLLLLPIIPIQTTLPLSLTLVFNAAGAIGDVLVALWLLMQPRTTLVHDIGDAITIYRLALL